MSESSEPAFPTKAVREKCNIAKDAYFDCLDINDENESLCSSLKKQFEHVCPAIWIPHYERRRKYLKFKEKMEKGQITDPVEVNAQKQKQA